MKVVWIYYVEYLEAYRICWPYDCARTLAYVSTILEGKLLADEQGLRLFILETPDFGRGY